MFTSRVKLFCMTVALLTIMVLPGVRVVCGQETVGNQVPPTTADYRKQFADELTTDRKGNGETFAVTGNEHRTFKAEVTAPSDAVALLANQFGVLLWQKGFEHLQIHILDGDQWMVSIGPWGYVETRSTLYCSAKSAPRQNAQLCVDPNEKPASPPLPQPDPVRPKTPSDKSREFIAIGLTDNAAKQGRHTTFVACGKNGAKDSLCIIDPDAPEDGYVARTGSNDKFAQLLYQSGFRHMAISNGRGGYWGGDIFPDKFTPQHEGNASLQLPDAHDAKPHAVNPSSKQSGTDASALLGQESKKSLATGQNLIREQRQKAQGEDDQDLLNSSLCMHETAASKDEMVFDFVEKMLTYTNVDRAKQRASQYWSAEEWQQYRAAQAQKRQYLELIGSSSDAHVDAFWRQAEDLARNFLGRQNGAYAITTQDPVKDAELNDLLLREVVASRREVVAVKITVTCPHY